MKDALKAVTEANKKKVKDKTHDVTCPKCGYKIGSDNDPDDMDSLK